MKWYQELMVTFMWMIGLVLLMTVLRLYKETQKLRKWLTRLQKDFDQQFHQTHESDQE